MSRDTGPGWLSGGKGAALERGKQYIVEEIKGDGSGASFREGTKDELFPSRASEGLQFYVKQKPGERSLTRKPRRKRAHERRPTKKS
jgi:hypothetical protein